MKSQVGIVIVTYNSESMISELLDSLPAALGGTAAAVVVVDNGSVDGTRDLLRRRTDCRLVASANGGYAAGINRGVRELGETDAILVLNPDTRLHAGCVAPLLEALQMPGTGIVAPQMMSGAGERQHSLHRKPTLLRALGLTRLKSAALSECVQEPDAYERPHVVDWATGAALMMSRECFDRLEGWDESYFLYGEETDLSLRARDLGLATRYEPEAVVTHIGGGSGRSGKTHAMQAINSVRVYGKRHAKIATWAYFGLTLARESSWVLRGHSERKLAVRALLQPSSRPTELHCSSSFLPGW